MDYGQKLQFGYFLTPSAERVDETLRLARLCDDLGLDLIGIQDHPYQQRFLDTWTLIAYLAAHTRRVRLLPDVINLPLRPPVMLAKAAASLDLLAGGRLDLGLGAGAFWEGIAAMGGPQRTPGESVAALEEAVQVMRLMWSGRRGVRFAGDYYQVNGAHSGPVPAHPIGLWIGAYGPKMLELTGRLGDGWVPSSSYAPREKLRGMQQQIDDAAARAGRAPAAIRRAYNIMGFIGGAPAKPFNGPPAQWVDDLSALASEEGIDTFIFSPSGDHENQVRLFGEKVVPRVRQARGSLL